MKPRLHQPGLPAGADECCNRVDHDALVHVQLDPIAMDIDALDQGYRYIDGTVWTGGSSPYSLDWLWEGGALS